MVKVGTIKMSPEQFLEKLKRQLSQRNNVSLQIDEAGQCPHFRISGSLNDTATIKGYYCESGDSFIQVAHSGREEFTNDELSAERFLKLIEDNL